MRILIDTSLLVKSERQNFDLGKWVAAARHEIFICDATIAEYIAGKPLKDAGKEQRWQNYWDSFVSLLVSVPLDREVCEKGRGTAGGRAARGNRRAAGRWPARCGCRAGRFDRSHD